MRHTHVSPPAARPRRWLPGCGAIVELTILLFGSGCPDHAIYFYSVVPCNGTEQAVSFEFPEPFGEIVEVAPCSCGEQLDGVAVAPRNAGSVLDFVHIRDVDGLEISNAEVLFTLWRQTPEAAQYLAYNGLQPFIPRFQSLPLTSPLRVELCNESRDPVHIAEDVQAATRLTEQTLVAPGGCRCWFTSSTHVTFVALTESSRRLATCGPFDPSAEPSPRVVWDGASLHCDDTDPPPPPPGTVEIQLCNLDEQSGLRVHMLFEGETPSEDSLLQLGQCRMVQVPEGEEAVFVVMDLSGFGVLGGCALTDPTTGDSATWDGQSLDCGEVPLPPSFAASNMKLEPIPDPGFAGSGRRANPLVELAKAYSSLSRDAKAAVREQVRQWLDAASPFDLPEPEPSGNKR